MINKLSMKTAIPLLLLMVFSSAVAYADGVSFRLYLRDVGSGAVVTIIDDGALDTNAGDGLIQFGQTVGDKGYVSGSAIVSKVGDLATLTLSASASYAGAGTMEVIVEEIFTAAKQQGSLVGTVGGVLGADLSTIGPLVALRNVNANFNTFVNTAGAVPSPGDPLPAAVATGFGPGGLALSSPLTSLTFPTNVGLPANFNFVGSQYSVYSVATLAFTGGSLGIKTGFADFTMRGDVSSFGPPLVSTSLPEPMSLLLLGSGLIGLGILRRRMP
jgi:hypothetical protein